ncbi:MAG TPA: efflux RND transporter periplasmic adaptor subunit [Steroidobacter sp.]
MRNLAKLGGIVAAASMMLAACGGQEGGHAPPPPEVAVQTVDDKPVPLELTYTARTVGSREVEVRARVGGILLKRRYEEGSRVKQGQPMFLIDPEPVRARVASARAAVAMAKARLEEARRERDRVLPLFEKNAVSQSRRDEVVSAYDVAEANLVAAESNLRTALLDLEYTDVRAPISGLTSREVLSEGSLVGTDQDSSLLTKIVQIEPLYVEFSVPQSEASLLRRSLNGGSGTVPVVKVIQEDGTEYPEPAKLTFVDNAVDINSGTVRVRAVLANSEGALIPGQFVRAKVEGVLLSNVVSIPRRAVVSSAQGTFVWLVDSEEKAQMRPVQISRTIGNNVVITDGLKPGERVIVDGVMKVHQPGIQVSAVTVDAATRQAESESTAGQEPA